MQDHRFVYVTFHTNSRSPRARRWYGLRIGIETVEGLHELRCATIEERKAADVATHEGRNKPEATKAARKLASALGLPCRAGLYRPGAFCRLERADGAA